MDGGVGEQMGKVNKSRTPDVLLSSNEADILGG